MKPGNPFWRRVLIPERRESFKMRGGDHFRQSSLLPLFRKEFFI